MSMRDLWDEERREFRMEEEMELERQMARDAEWNEQQSDPRRAVCISEDWVGDCLPPTVYDREDEIPF